MFVDGVVKNYNAERGFGLISVDGQKKEIFFHITDCPNRNVEPKQGERLKFRIVDDQGKSKAQNIVRLDIQSEAERHTPQSRANARKNITQRRTNNKSSSGSGFGMTVIGLLVIVGLIYMLYGKYQRVQLANQPVATIQQIAEPTNLNPNNYRCDGRVHCSQMNSREEARWFVRNCPGTKMDGNHDGEPCENDSRW